MGADRRLPIWGGRTYIMGVINVTSDSFSGDGIGQDARRAAELAVRMEAEGADIVDIGGESTRPGFSPVTVEEELRRVIPAVTTVVARCTVPVSVDTTKGRVAAEALAAGATYINDVSGSRDPGITEAVAYHEAWLILVNNGANGSRPIAVSEIADDLQRQVDVARDAGVDPDRIVVDPGLGMGKGWRDNFEIMRNLSAFGTLGMPILIGPSRKGMIGRVLSVPPSDRLEGTAALVSLCIANGADSVRVHDVKPMVRVARMMDALVR